MRSAVASVLLALLAAACGSSPKPPTAPSDPPAGSNAAPRVSEVRIAGIPPALKPGATAQLKAETVLETGTVNECAAAWSVNTPHVASVSSSGLLTALFTGTVKVAASCEGLTTRVETNVERMNPYDLVIVAHDSGVQGAHVAADIEFLDGIRAGRRMPLERVNSHGMPEVTLPVNVRLTADGYAPKDLTLAAPQGDPSRFVHVWVPMTFVPDALTDTYTGEVREGSVKRYRFTMRRPGPVQVRTWWGGEYNDRIFVELWCDGRMLQRVRQSSSRGQGFTHDVPAPGRCDVRLEPDHIEVTYRVAIRYER